MAGILAIFTTHVTGTLTHFGEQLASSARHLGRNPFDKSAFISHTGVKTGYGDPKRTLSILNLNIIGQPRWYWPSIGISDTVAQSSSIRRIPTASSGCRSAAWRHPSGYPTVLSIRPTAASWTCISGTNISPGYAAPLWL